MISPIDEAKKRGPGRMTLRRLTATAGEVSMGVGRGFRLDPMDLPARYSAAIGTGGRRVDAVIVLDRQEVIIKRPSPAGASATFRMPTKSFDGVAVRIVPIGDDGDLEVTVELMHRDPGLSIPLIIADDPGDVAADWQTWGRVLGLPLLLVLPDGSIEKPVDHIGAIRKLPTRPRRRHSFFANRRPRFLTRRKTGLKRGEIEILDAREIIART
jgi:hypothetical protein